MAGSMPAWAPLSSPAAGSVLRAPCQQQASGSGAPERVHHGRPGLRLPSARCRGSRSGTCVEFRAQHESGIEPRVTFRTRVHRCGAYCTALAKPICPCPMAPWRARCPPGRLSRSPVGCELPGSTVSGRRSRRAPPYGAPPNRVGIQHCPRLDAGGSADAGSEDSQMACGAPWGSSSAWGRITLWVSTVAKRRLAPMSSATISTLDRNVWSSVSQPRWSRRPVTTTLAPW